MLKALRINKQDEVAIIPYKVKAGEQVEIVGTGEVFTAVDDIPAGHKMALKNLEKGHTVIKYGIPIGVMGQDCPVGGWVHDHNLIDTTAEICTGYCEKYKAGGKKILAYPRANGTYGVRNYIMVFSTSVEANKLAEELSENTGILWWVCDKRTVVDGCITEQTQRYVKDMAKTPNIYAAMIVGSAANKVVNEALVEAIRAEGQKPVSYFEYDAENHDALYGACFKVIEGWKAEAAAMERKEVPFAGFTMSIHCGGSDWTTALSGNPTLGVASDMVVENGGYVIMDEWAGFPGSEHLLAGHAVDHTLGCRIIDKVQGIRAKILAETGKPVEAMNPFPANKEGGITTLVEKSTGNIKKAGSTPIQAILEPGVYPKVPGVYIQDQPSLAPHSTGMFAAMSGCHISVFVTGVGFVYFELPFMPVVRMTGNPITFQKKEYKLDFDAGQVIEGREMSEVGKDLFDYLVAVAEGKEEPKCEDGKAKVFTMYNPDDEYTDMKFCGLTTHRKSAQEKADRVKQ